MLIVHSAVSAGKVGVDFGMGDGSDLGAPAACVQLESNTLERNVNKRAARVILSSFVLV